ncbi:MAG: DUF3089 domain-containing protein [Candidatus Limnocylindrales bacterium]
MNRRIFLIALAFALAVGACGSSSSPTPAPTPAPTAAATLMPTATAPSATVAATASASASSTVDPTVSAAPVPDDTVWLCKPGLANDPCSGNLNATSVDASGAATLQPAAPVPDPPIDCFYVYPTVSRQTTTNANLTIDPEERAVAVAQAARFSQVCRVYAPMYRQLTLAAIAKPSSISLASALVAYAGVDSAFRDYMADYNHGRGVVFIGHSQGAMLLTALLKYEVDPDSAALRLTVSALLMGGNVTVPVGKTVGGDFANIPACASVGQTGCVVAYSSFDTTPPAGAVFGRIGSPIDPFATSSTVPLQILCVNPASPSGGSAPLEPYFPTAGLSLFLGSHAPALTASTPFVTYPNEFSAECKSAGGANWLQIDRTGGTSDVRPGLSIAEAPTWGLHVVDVNIALGNLVDLVRSESAAYR